MENGGGLGRRLVICEMCYVVGGGCVFVICVMWWMGVSSAPGGGQFACALHVAKHVQLTLGSAIGRNTISAMTTIDGRNQAQVSEVNIWRNHALLLIQEGRGIHIMPSGYLLLIVRAVKSVCSL